MRIESEIKLHYSTQYKDSFLKETILKTITSSLSIFNIQIDNVTKAIHFDLYFDTESYLLYKTDSSLRIRQDENRLILKEKSKHSNFSLLRIERNSHLSKNDSVIKAANELFHKYINADFVSPKLYIYLIRDSIYITTNHGRYQICVDEYTCFINKYSNSQKYIEIETILSNIDEDPELNQFITYIVKRYKLINIYKSKYQIGISTYIEKESY